MSNPAVITLENLSSGQGRFKRFVIEDNIGEAIHLHIDNIRVDLSVKEFLNFSGIIRESLTKLDFLAGYDLSDFDESFLRDCSELLTDLIDIKIEETEISKLKCIVYYRYRGNLIYKIEPVTNTPAYKYLAGMKNEFIEYQQSNYFDISNEQRLLDNYESINRNKYPFNNQYIILFNGQDIIRDGQHRASILAHLYGVNTKIKIMRFYFKSKDHFLKPFIHKKIITKWHIKRVAGIIRSAAGPLFNI